MKCQQCGTADVAFLECRQFGVRAQHRLWLYRCPYCSAAYTATQVDWSTLPFVSFHDSSTSPRGNVVQDVEDILVTNPDPQKRVWCATQEGPNPVLVAPTSDRVPFLRQDETTPSQKQNDVCLHCQRSTIFLYHCTSCGSMVCFDCSSKGEQGRVCVRCAPSPNDLQQAPARDRPSL